MLRMAALPIDDKQLMALWTMHAPRVFAYILSLEPNRDNAEDIFQETGITVWEKRSDFVVGTDFRAWASRIAYINMLNFVRRHRKLETAHEQLLETLAAESESISDQVTPRLRALTDCMSKLSPRDRQILDLRYGPSGTVKHVAETVKLSVIGAYKALQRVHESLFRCIQRELEREDRS